MIMMVVLISTTSRRAITDRGSQADLHSASLWPASTAAAIAAQASSRVWVRSCGTMCVPSKRLIVENISDTTEQAAWPDAYRRGGAVFGAAVAGGELERSESSGVEVSTRLSGGSGRVRVLCPRASTPIPTFASPLRSANTRVEEPPRTRLNTVRVVPF